MDTEPLPSVTSWRPCLAATLLRPHKISSDSGDGLDEQQYTLDDIDDALPDERTDTDTSDTDTQTPDADQETSHDNDTDDDDSVGYDQIM